MIMAIQFIEIQTLKKKCLWKKLDKSLAHTMEKGKKYSVGGISPFPTVFFKKEIDLAILQEIGILQQLQFSTCFIVCCVTRLFFQQALYQSHHPYTGRPV